MKKMLLVLFFLNGCATQGFDRSDKNEMIKEFYASVESMKQVELSSNVVVGIVGAGTAGVIENSDGNHEDMISGGLAGALVGGIFTALFEGSNTAYEYSLNSEVEGDFSVIQKKKINIQTECVKIRTGHKVRIFPASKDKCATLKSEA